MEILKSCMDEMLKFTLESSLNHAVGFDLGLSSDFCSGLLRDPGSDGSESFEGVPSYPLYKSLSLALLRSIDSGAFCRPNEKITTIFEDTWVKKKEEEWDGLIAEKGSELVKEVRRYSSFKEMVEAESVDEVFPRVIIATEDGQISSGVDAIDVSTTAVQPCIILANLLSGLSYAGVQSLLGLSHTVGTISNALPPPRSTLLASFTLPYKLQVKGCSLSHGARALAKHADRSSDKFWGVLHGSDTDKNRLAKEVINRLVSCCRCMNVHIVPPHGAVFEIRVAEGYGARWSHDGTKFIGFLEPYMEDGHSKGWKH